MTDEEIRQYVLEKTLSNTHYENGERILELSFEGLRDFFEVTDVILSN